MDIVLDSSSIINLINGDCIDKILSLDTHKFFIGDQILEQEILDDLQKTILEAFIAMNKIVLLKALVTVSDIITHQKKHKLGLGETEGMVICKATGYTLCSDDLKGRTCSELELSKKRVVGTLFLLRECVLDQIIECREAVASYNLMIKKGGFLPRDFDVRYFCPKI